MKPYYKKFIKFLYVSAEYESLPADVKPEVRRASVIKLDEAVAELVADDEIERLAEIVERTFVQRKPSRRQSVPWSCTNCIPLSPHLLCIKRTSRTALKHSAFKLTTFHFYSTIYLSTTIIPQSIVRL